MATVAEMRAWLLDNTSEEVPARGRLHPDLVRMYQIAHPVSADPADDDPDWDLDGDGDLAGAEDLEPSVPMQPERAPRTARAARAERRAQPVTRQASTLLGKLMGSDTKKNAAAKGKKKIPRTSLEKFISNRYADIGKYLAPFSQPMSRCIQAQAAFAGIVWEDIVRDTIIDKGLQPIARAEEKLDKGFALVVTPLAVLAIEQSQVALQNGAITVGQFAVRQAVTMPMLREGLRRQLQISKLYADQIKARLEEDAEIEGEVDNLIAMIFQPPQGVTVEEPQMAGAAA